MKQDRIYINHICECIDDIERYVGLNKALFMIDDLVRNACLRQLQIMSESCTRLSPELRQSLTMIDWAQIAGFRNILVHEYNGKINFDIVWDVIEHRLPMLKKIMKEIKD